MRQRMLGRTGQAISEIGFGGGNVGGLLIRGEQRDQVRAVARAVELGITYFDTAAQYGDGQSETNLGRALAELKPDVIVGTKISVRPADLDAGHARVESMFEDGLRRLGRERVDVLFYHGQIASQPRDGRALTSEQVLGPLLESFRRFREVGKVRYLGFTGLGDTAAVLAAIQPNAFDVMHCYFSAANPSAAYAVGPSFAPQNLGGIVERASAVGMGLFVIRVLAAGALAGEPERHPIAGGTGGTLISGTDYQADAERAERLRAVASDLGISLAEMAIRFVLSHEQISTALVGISSVDQVEFAAKAADAGPLPPNVLRRIVETTTF
ncbi:MAG: hypothetical protein HW416_2216 [Chloroflexi bacterium]|nr:hypothetical protein [Chloroflexota bacterium]